MKRMVTDHPPETVTVYPPMWCNAICLNALSDLCLEGCAAAGDCRFFKIKRGVKFQQLARFPLEEFLNGMSPQVRQIVIGIYVAKLTDLLKEMEI